MQKILAFVFILIGSLSALDSHQTSFDIGVSINSTNFPKRAKLDFKSSLARPLGLTDVILSPGMSIYADSSFDCHFGVGFRKPLKDKCVLGSHAFYEMTIPQALKLQQVGFNIECLSRKLDTSFNYYHPVMCPPRGLVCRERWCELDFIYKMGFVSTGFCPSYNFTKKIWSVKPKIVLPFRLCKIEAGAVFSENAAETKGYISVGIPLYRMGDKPVSRAHSVRHFIAPEVKKKLLAHCPSLCL